MNAAGPVDQWTYRGLALSSRNRVRHHDVMKTPRSRANIEPIITGSTPGVTTEITAQQRAYETIRDALIAGLFMPGEVVTLRLFSERLGVSSMPVREALKRLVSEGAFEALPNHSARVPVLSRSEVEQIAELRQELETRAVRLAAEHLSKRHLDELEEISKRMEELHFPQDVNEYARLNKQFHFTIYRLADNPPLLRLIEYLWLRMAPFVYAIGVVAAREGRRSRPVPEHQRLIKALRNHDVDAAMNALRADLEIPAGFPDYARVLEESAAGRLKPGKRKPSKTSRGRPRA